MTPAPSAPLQSRINTPGCDWDFSADCVSALEALKVADSAAHSLMQAMVERAHSSGLPASENASAVEPVSHPTHRAPVGGRVMGLKFEGKASHGFTSQKPLPWAGELIVEGSNGDTDHRLYFVEGRPTWVADTDLIVGGDMCSKGVAGGYDLDLQTRDIRDAMHKGISVCKGHQRKWRLWNSP